MASFGLRFAPALANPMRPKTPLYLRRSDSQRSRNDFHIVHLCDSRPPQFETRRVTLSGPTALLAVCGGPDYMDVIADLVLMGFATASQETMRGGGRKIE